MKINSFQGEEIVIKTSYNRWTQQYRDVIVELNIDSCDCGILKANATIPVGHKTGAAMQYKWKC